MVDIRGSMHGHNDHIYSDPSVRTLCCYTHVSPNLPLLYALTI
jgi:hypothetical protein